MNDYIGVITTLFQATEDGYRSIQAYCRCGGRLHGIDYGYETRLPGIQVRHIEISCTECGYPQGYKQKREALQELESAWLEFSKE